ncbi:hypothetical protein [Streptomyces xantholiticus]|uniref:Uncharacterized protein n=1 Tax=Streptomyces xantholiticus TaxID=68285 RepID=A0ABV1UU83_9ACTN
MTTVTLPLTAMRAEVMALALREPRGPRSLVLRVGGEVVLRSGVGPSTAVSGAHPRFETGAHDGTG